MIRAVNWKWGYEMGLIIVCPLAEVELAAKQYQPSHMVSLVDASMPVTRPEMVSPDRHLWLKLNDISSYRPQTPELAAPNEAHVKQLLNFTQQWQLHPQQAPMLVHCWMGISRSTAAAFIINCACNPQRSEVEIASELRFLAPFATPNPGLVALADKLLARKGRMVAAIKKIGRGAFFSRGQIFLLEF